MNKYILYKKMRESTYLKMLKYNINDDHLIDMINRDTNIIYTSNDIDDMVEFMHFIDTVNKEIEESGVDD